MKIKTSTHPLLVKVAKHVYPDYKGRKFYLEYKEKVDIGVDANWSGGTRKYYKFVRLDNGSILNPPDIAPWKRPDNEEVQIPNGAACITHAFFCGHDCGLTIILPNQNQIEEKLS
jgi:hypothetical protein